MDKIFDSIMDFLGNTEEEMKNKLIHPPRNKAFEVCVLIYAALKLCEIPPSEELFDKIFDRIYLPQPTAKEKRETREAIAQTIDKTIGSILEMFALSKNDGGDVYGEDLQI